MKLRWWMWTIIVALIILWAVWAGQLWFWQAKGIDIGDPAVRGQWGDTFGGLNALLSALAFLGLMGTLWMQQQQITDSRRDVHLQRFETSFFEILKMVREAREQVRFRPSPDVARQSTKFRERTYYGHQAFRAAYAEMTYWLSEQDPDEIDRELVSALYEEHVHRRYESTFGAYYRLLYWTLDRLRSDQFLSETEKDELGNLIRSQFTSFEVILAGCNGLNEFAKDFDDIIVRFRLLKYGRRGELYRALRAIYDREAFLGRDEREEADIEEENDDFGPEEELQ